MIILAMCISSYAIYVKNDEIPLTIISHFSGPCPEGWTHVAAAEGRYIVADQVNISSVVGRPLADQENRAVALHSHGVTDPGHAHNIPVRDTETGGVAFDGDNQLLSANITIGNSATGLTVVSTGAKAGTNGPYLQVEVCSRI